MVSKVQLVEIITCTTFHLSSRFKVCTQWEPTSQCWLRGRKRHNTSPESRRLNSNSVPSWWGNRNTENAYQRSDADPNLPCSLWLFVMLFTIFKALSNSQAIHLEAVCLRQIQVMLDVTKQQPELEQQWLFSQCQYSSQCMLLIFALSNLYLFPNLTDLQWRLVGKWPY